MMKTTLIFMAEIEYDNDAQKEDAEKAIFDGLDMARKKYPKQIKFQYVQDNET